MTSDIRIFEVENDPPDGIIVTFSDGTVAGYVVEELLELRPHREPASDSPGSERSVLSPFGELLNHHIS